MAKDEYGYKLQRMKLFRNKDLSHLHGSGKFLSGVTY